MATASDEELLRNALHDLTAVQPDAPVDRFAAIRRRHRRRREAQGAVAAAIAVGAVVAGLLASGLPGRSAAPPTSHRKVPSWALSWPEHLDPSISRTELDDAVRAWRQQDGRPMTSLFAPRQVIWYAAEPAAGRSAVALVFEVERDDGSHVLVTAVHPQANRSDWVFRTVAAPDPRATDIVSFYWSKLSDNGVIDNWVVAITRPGVSPLLLRVGAHAVGVTSLTGYTDAKVGPLREQVRIDGHGLVGLPGDPDSAVPDLQAPEPLVGLPHPPSVGEFTGSGNLVSGDESSTARGRMVVDGRCYAAGGASPKLIVAADREDGPHVTIPCDDKQHHVVGPFVTPGHSDLAGTAKGRGYAFYVLADKLVAYRVAVDVH
jgi:hypothetical protein